MALRIAALVKQIPAFEEMRLGPDGRLVRAGLEREMNPYCRRAVAQAVELAATHGGQVTAITVGPPEAEDVLREAVAWAEARGVAAEGVLVSDPALAGADTLVTARALAATVRALEGFDLVLCGRSSVDADTGQIGPELAELLDLPFAGGVRHLAITDGGADVRCEHDDGWLQARLGLPAVLSTAERLIDPCKVDAAGRAAVAASAIRTMTTSDLGGGPWGADASPTWVGPVRVVATTRERVLQPDAPLDQQVTDAVARLVARGALATDDAQGAQTAVIATPAGRGDAVLVVGEPDRALLTRELLGAAARLAAAIGGHAALLALDPGLGASTGARWGAAVVARVDGATVEEDAASALVAEVCARRPWAVLAPSTMWGREVAGRAAAALGAGLTGDAVELDVEDGRLIAWKPALGGQLVAAVGSRSPVQMVTVRAGVLPAPAPLADPAAPEVTTRAVTPRGRVRVLARTRDDDLDVLASAPAVVGVGRGVDPADYPQLEPLLAVLGAELAATRKVTDQGWLPRARQLGITGRSIAPRLYVAIGVGGKYNHTVGVRAAGTVLAVNADADAPVFAHADVGIVGDWHDVVPRLVDALARART